MPRIVVSHATKRYGAITAVDDRDIHLEPGTLTGFVGANGAGKSTTLRMLVGLTRPTSGTALIDGNRCGSARPGADRGRAHRSGRLPSGRSGRNALRVLARTSRIADRRVDEVLEMVDLTSAARRRVGSYSTGMRQRLDSPPRCSAIRPR